MKTSILFSSFLFSVFFTSFFTSNAHVQEVQPGVFLGYQDLKRGEGITKKTHQSTFFEKKEDETDSFVFDIRSQLQFKTFVVKNSMHKPVVLKIYKSGQADTNTSDQAKVFQEVAEVFSSSVVFAGLDLSKNNGKFEDVLEIKDENLPLIIFFENGKVQTPFVPANQHKNYLVTLIENRFFKK